MSQGSAAAVASPLAGTPTAKDGLFFLTILMNMTNKPEVDWNLVAAESGFKNAKVASTRFGQMKKKFIPDGSLPMTPRRNGKASTPTSPNISFSSTATIPNTPSGSPKKRGLVKKEVGSGTNLMSNASNRVRKSPIKIRTQSNTRTVNLDDSEDGNDDDEEDANSITVHARMQGVKYKYEDEDGDEEFLPYSR